MKRLALGILLASLPAMGCTSAPKFWERSKPPAPPVAQAARPAAPVTAAQISDKNAGQMAGALAREVEQDTGGASGIRQASATSTESVPCAH
jgi:hypothetical protein